MTAPVSPSRGASLWQRWRFHLSALVLIVPVAFAPAFFHENALFDGKKGLGEREIGEIAVGPWSVRLAEFRVVEPDAEGRAGYAKEFTLALCPACVDSVKAAYLRVGQPRNVRVAGALFSGTPYRQTAEIRIPERTTADDKLWLTLEGWDGTLHQAAIPIRAASPVMAAWLEKAKR
ncbi:MAG: thiamine pyrophosphate-binding protein [Xanthobacteraceae bacterium]